MTLNGWLKQAEQQLSSAGIGTARLDALVLLENVTGKDRAWLLAHPDHKLSTPEQAKLTKLLTRRSQHEPLAYIRGTTEFYGRNFVISPAVLEPRPESETMIDLLKKLPDVPSKPLIADVGTGSGALGITAKLELPDSTVELLEIDEKALKIAQTNVDKYTISVNVLRSDLLSKSSQSNHVLLCNLPYVPDDYQINQAAGQEPKLAIFGGPDGLDLYRRLFQQVANLSEQPLYLLTECLPPQHTVLQAIAEKTQYKLLKSDDFIQVFRHA